MERAQFACPHCNEPFEVDDPSGGKAIACPSCGDLVALPAGSPAAVSEDLEGNTRHGESSDLPDSPASFVAFDFRDQVTSVLRPRRYKRKRRASDRHIERLSRSEKQRRQARRSLVMMIFGLIVLFIAVVLLNRF